MLKNVADMLPEHPLTTLLIILMVAIDFKADYFSASKFAFNYPSNSVS
jgi:hypothetical protein